MKEQPILSLDTLVRLKGKELRSRGTEDGTTRALFSSGPKNALDGLKSYSFGLKPKYPPFKGWDDESK